MVAKKVVRAFLHRIDVQRMVHLPDQPGLMCRRGTSHQDAEQIASFHC